MSPRWGFKTFRYPVRYNHVAPLGLKLETPVHYTYRAPLGRKTGGDIALCSQNMCLIRTMTPRHDTHVAPLGL